MKEDKNNKRLFEVYCIIVDAILAEKRSGGYDELMKKMRNTKSHV